MLDLFNRNKKTNAAIAKERLKIIIEHERKGRGNPEFLPRLEKEILDVVRKYVSVDEDAVSVSIDRQEHVDLLEVNVVIPENNK